MAAQPSANHCSELLSQPLFHTHNPTNQLRFLIIVKFRNLAICKGNVVDF
ncbi:MAG: hypothetical protein FD170_1867 [Bacteroidetes bacterium]|nr:MAG: hypothetical protein FD170_1867 [Bacteroidota bacterium]